MPTSKRKPRALVVAIENYPQANGLATNLPRTIAAGQKFYNWLVNTKGLDPQDILICSDGPNPADLPAANQHDGTRASIKTVLIELIKAGQDKTSEIYFFFSGHGLAWKVEAHRRPLDVIVASDFKSAEYSGDLCVKLSEIEQVLQIFVGGADHYIFLDACRNVLPGDAIQVGSLAIAPAKIAELGNPTHYRIYSTTPGNVADIDSGFSDFLLKGLHGEGRAKEETPEGNFWVQFDRLKDYILGGVGPGQKIDPVKEGTGAGLIYRLPDPVEYKCKLVVDDAKQDARFTLAVTTDSLPVGDQSQFVGPEFTLVLKPRFKGYQFRVSEGLTALTQVAPPANSIVDMFEDTEVHFQHPGDGGGMDFENVELGPPYLKVTTFDEVHWKGEAEVRLINHDTRQSMANKGGFEGKLDAGNWDIETWFQGRKVDTRSIELVQGDSQLIELGQPALRSRTVESIAAYLPQSAGGRIAEMSESLGPLVERDPALWLALLGAARILQPPDLFSKIKDAGLATFDDVAPDTGVIYALFGREVSEAPGFGLVGSPGAELAPVANMKDVLQARLPAPNGQQFVTIARSGQLSRTYATIVLPNRATFFVFTEDESGALQTQQFLLPMSHLIDHLDGPVPELVRRQSWDYEFGSLKLTRLLSNAQRRYLAREAMTDGTTDAERQRWLEMIYGKWVEPLVAIMAGFDMLTRDRAQQENNLRTMASNLGEFFGGIPDVEVFRALVERRTPAPVGVPLLRDSLLRVPGLTGRLQFPASRLDYDSAFTCWVGV